MNIITTFDQLKAVERKEFVFPATIICQDEVRDFGILSGDMNVHNRQATKQFPLGPVVQGSFMFALFGEFHTQLCILSDRDAILHKAKEIYSGPVYISQYFIPCLNPVSVMRRGNLVSVTWIYSAKNLDSADLFCMEIKYFYTPLTA